MASRAPGPILIVEDNDETRTVLERILAVSGYWTASAEDGQEALDYLRNPKNASPVVILLDLSMPGMDGRTFLRQFRAFPDLAQIPVVVYSGYPGTVPDVAACVRKGS